MRRSTRDKIISRIVKMESRISQCNRCKGIKTCSPGLSFGRGDVEADILVVFLRDSEFTRSRDMILNMRAAISEISGGKSVYHTFMVRCQPRMCSRRWGKDVLFEGTLIDNNQVCLLTQDRCDGMLIEPSDHEIMNCLHYLLEEIEIIAPQVIISCGERTSQYLFKAFGMLDPINKAFIDVKNKPYRIGTFFLIPTDIPSTDESVFKGLSKPFAQIVE